MGVSEGYVYRGNDIPISWNGFEARAWVPEPLAAQAFDVGPQAIRLTERAAAAAVAASHRTSVLGPLATLLLRSEGVASSSIEGLHAPVADVAAAEVGGANSDVAVHVADNLGAVVGAIAAPERALSQKDIMAWHRRLTGSGGALPPRMVGRYRTEQSWVGGTSPQDAAFVPPPAALVGDLMADLVSFANDTSLDPVTQAAVIHAQFESIHPFADGNGRIGRVLIGWVLAHRLELRVPPPVSVLIARDRGGYLAGLALFRMGQLDPWVEWVARALQRSSEAAGDLAARAEVLFDDWRVRTSEVRTDAAARRLLELLPEHPVLTAAWVAERLGVSSRSGQYALSELAARGIVERYRPRRPGRGRPSQYWVAQELIDLVSAWSAGTS